MLFIFDVPVTSNDVNDTDIRISIEVIEINGCRLNIGFTENSDRVSANADHPNMYLILDNAEWHSMGDPYNFYTPAFEILGKDNLVVSTVKTIDISNRNNNYALPPKIFAVVGKEVNVYFDNLVGDSIKNYLVDVNCDVGIQQNERWTFIPNEAGTWQLSITFYDQFLNIINTANSTMLVTLPDAETGENSKCLFIGDSTTEAAVYTAELLKLFNNNITLIGTKGIAPNLFEATGGWTVDIHYSSALSSFVFDGVFNFTRYMTSNNFTTIDWIFIHLGINDVFNCADDLSVDTVINNNYTKLENMIASMKQFNTNVKIGYMLTIPPSANQDAFGKNYLCNTTQWRYKRNIHRYTVAMLNNFRDREGENIYLIPTNCNLDTEHNMSAETVPINSRNASTIVRQNNGVHPDLAGYYQMADTVYYALKNI
jgi:lysophospholipase L1-like esterase